MKIAPKVLAPILTLLAATLVMGALLATRRAPESTRPEVLAPLVTIQIAETRTAVFSVRAQGTVEPRTESDLVTEVDGRILEVSPRLASGAFFAEGDVLARIDARVYEIAVEGARAALARAQSQLSLSGSNLERERSMGRGGATSQAKLDDARHARAAAEASLREARVALERAEYDLARCEIRAPFAGRVREKFVDVGEFVNRGQDLARIFAVDYAEIRLSISDGDMAFLDLSLGYRTDPLKGDGTAETPLPAVAGPVVQLAAEFAGERHTWQGRVDRVEGALDPKTRTVHVVVRVDDPYGRSDGSPRPPLAVGLFVQADIQGRAVEGLFALPRSSLRGSGEVVVLDAEDRARLRAVDVVRAEAERVWLRSGIEAGDHVVTTPLGVVVEGMRLRAADDVAMRTAAAEEPAR